MDDKQDALLAELKLVNENLRMLHNDVINLQSVVDSVIAAISILPNALKNVLRQDEQH